MNGATKSYKEQRKLLNEYLSKNNIYESSRQPKFDMHRYAAYVKGHTLSADDITPDILEMFLE